LNIFYFFLAKCFHSLNLSMKVAFLWKTYSEWKNKNLISECPVYALLSLVESKSTYCNILFMFESFSYLEI
jgi:hypothetical protein